MFLRFLNVTFEDISLDYGLTKLLLFQDLKIISHKRFSKHISKSTWDEISK